VTISADPVQQRRSVTSFTVAGNRSGPKWLLADEVGKYLVLDRSTVTRRQTAEHRFRYHFPPCSAMDEYLHCSWSVKAETV